MFPYLLKIGDRPILHTYGLCLALGLIVGHWLLTRELRRRNLPETWAGTEILLAAVFGIIGSKIFDILEHPGNFSHDPIGTLFSGSGLTWYGGFILATLAIWIAARRKRLPWWVIVDASTPGLAIGYGFGRLGCFLSGDGCYGTACTANLPAPLCMAFPDGIVKTTEVVYNTPLWEIGGAILTFALIWSIRSRIHRAPGLFFLWIIIHGLLRFLVEFVRRNPELMFGLSQAQVISLGLMVAGILGLIFLNRFGQPSVSPVPIAAESSGATSHQHHGSGRKSKGRKR